MPPGAAARLVRASKKHRASHEAGSRGAPPRTSCSPGAQRVPATLGAGPIGTRRLPCSPRIGGLAATFTQRFRIGRLALVCDWREEASTTPARADASQACIEKLLVVPCGCVTDRRRTQLLRRSTALAAGLGKASLTFARCQGTFTACAIKLGNSGSSGACRRLSWPQRLASRGRR